MKNREALAGARAHPHAAAGWTTSRSFSSAVHALRKYLHGDDLMLCTVVDTATDARAAAYWLSIRHHRQLSFAFAKLWSRG
jgi:hypothetical protein